MSMIEISSDDIARLDDTSLRSLIGMLCEADYRMGSLPVTGIRFSGHQDAADGGIDVIVDSAAPPPLNSFIPNKITGFQVKKSNMPPSAIKAEMVKDGKLKPAIKDLVAKKGAYIIVSSGSCVTESQYRNRIIAMKDAVANESEYENLSLDFFDSGKIASWVRCHPSMVLWVRNKIGNPIQGWQPYDNWSNAPEGVNEAYILDEKLRLFDESKSKDEGISTEQGISLLRKQLSIQGKSVRLAGLSGVGKTRLVQALFDDNIGSDALDPSLALYTDISNGPIPDPKFFAEQLQATGARVIMIVDNCTPELHRQLTRICAANGSRISLLTVEYDVKEDIPEETSVFRLQPASTGVIEQLIRNRYFYINQTGAKVIADFSDGNARVAIALAATFKRGETLSGFQDEELFKRLFWQRNNPNEDLLQCAEVCSLLYSFEGTETGEGSELSMLASLIDKSGDFLFRKVQELRDRDLVQSRSKWRAVLPHAIANRLAKRALANIPKSKLVTTIISSKERVILSFTRRLSFLHDCEEATNIVSDWLTKEGWIGKHILQLSDFGIRVLKNVAPVCPEETLKILEVAANDPEKGDWFASRNNPKFYDFTRLLRHLAYEEKSFRNSVHLLAKIALTENIDEKNNPIRGYFKSLFSIYLSGTHASPAERASYLAQLLNDDHVDIQQLGLSGLNTALEAWHFSSHYDFSFGARPRDYGWRPKSAEDELLWYKTFIDLCVAHIISDKPTASEAKKILADKIRGLWTKAKAYDALEAAIDKICATQTWTEGWIAANSIYKFDAKGMPIDALERLKALIARLKAKDLEGLVRTYALTDQHFIWDLEDNYTIDEMIDLGLDRLKTKTEHIGILLAQDEAVINKLLPDLLTTYNSRIYDFGVGFGNGSDDKEKTWNALYAQVKNIPKEKRQTTFLCGYLNSCAKSNPKLHNKIMDNLVGDEVLGQWFPIFQVTTKIDKLALQRLHKFIAIEDSEIGQIGVLAYGRSHENISDDDLADLLKEILKEENGYFPAAEIIKMRFHENRQPPIYSDRLIAVGYQIIEECEFSESRRRHSLMDYDLKVIANVCFPKSGFEKEVKRISERIYGALIKGEIFGSSFGQFINVLAKHYPTVFLNTFLREDNEENHYKTQRIFSLNFERGNNPLNGVDDQTIIEWCDVRPEVRYILVADAIIPFESTNEDNSFEWKKIVHQLFEKAPDIGPVLKKISESIRPSGWSGSLADILQERLILFDRLKDHPNEQIKSWANDEHAKLLVEIEREREWEIERFRKENESFE